MLSPLAYLQRAALGPLTFAAIAAIQLCAVAQEPAPTAPPAASAPAAATPTAPPAPTAVASAPVATPAPVPAPPQFDPKVVKQLETILTGSKFSRDPADVLHGLERVTTDINALPPNDRFMLRFRTADWAKIREELAAMPPDLARKIYDKVLGDLTEKQKPNVKLEDALGIADAVPGDFTNDEIRKLGQLLNLSVPATDTYWLSDRIAKGTDRIGGSDPAKRLLAGRVLMAGGFKELAREYLPPLEAVDKIADEGVRNEISQFLNTQRETESTIRGQMQRTWDDNIRALIASSSKSNEWERAKAAAALSKIIAQVPATTVAPTIADLVKNNQEGAIRLVGIIAKRVADKPNKDAAIRTEELKAQYSIANITADQVDASTQPWGQIFDTMADAWTAEAETTFTLKRDAAPNAPTKWVLPEDLLATAPSGKWEAALSKPTRDRLDVGLSRAILAGANFDQASERIVAIGKRSPKAGAALAEDFLSAWAKSHNPQIPEALRKKFDLPEDARIPVTPIMMEKNIDSLAAMMKLFRDNNLAPADYGKVLNAFDLAYSNAETYRTGHIVKVFGSLEKMDEPLFFQILSKMSGNLGDRWRKMDVQKAGLTKRDEAETLDLVRSGYGSALGMIQSWLAGHPDSARALTLAGTLLSDWGDFEYFQELVTTDTHVRMTGYKEKNLQAQEYFEKAAEAYAKTVPNLAPSDYSVETYLAWFNSLLGISSTGQVNLSKAMNRAALDKIRESMMGLGPKPGPVHIGQFAKIVNGRLNDEKEPLHEDLKYRYLASALVVTKDDPFTLGAEKKVAYYDELLSEVRLQTRVDGANTVARDQDFGIILSIVHTEAMGRVAKFGQYLSNELTGTPGKPRKKAGINAKKMRDAQGPRDELELSLTEKLSPFFDIKSITFATPDVKPRPTQQTGWEETVLAYLQVRAKDASVDKIPPVQLQLKFVDLTGPITVPAESAETIIKVVAEGAPARPAKAIEITQTIDTRQLLINGSLPLEIKATATGLVPDLDQLLDLEALKKQLEIKNVNPHEGLQIKELNTWGDAVAPRSERLWSVALDGDKIRQSGEPIQFQFPPAKAEGTMVYQTYKEMNLVTLQEPTVEIGRPLTAGEQVASHSHGILWTLVIIVILAGAAGAYYYVTNQNRTAEVGKVRASDVIKMPQDVDGFSIVALLRKLRSSPLVHIPEGEKPELQSDIQRVQQACFGSSAPSLSENDLRGIAEKWLRFIH